MFYLYAFFTEVEEFSREGMFDHSAVRAFPILFDDRTLRFLCFEKPGVQKPRQIIGQMRLGVEIMKNPILKPCVAVVLDNIEKGEGRFQ